MLIKTGAVSKDGSLCIALENPSDRADDTVVFVFDTSEWRRFDPMDLIEAVCPVPGSTPQGAQFIALSSEGRVFELVGDMPFSQIPGPGFEGSEASGRGPIVFAQLIADRPTAFGFGAQVYVMEADSVFLPLTDQIPVVQDYPNDDIKFVSGAYQADKNTWIMVGSIVTASPDSLEIDEANDSGDVDALVEALLAETRADYGCIFVYENDTWRMLEVPTDDLVDSVLTDPAGLVYVRMREGTLVALPTNDEWQIVYDDGELIAGECIFGQEVVFAAGNELLRVENGITYPLEPPMPEAPGYVVELLATNDSLIVLRSESISVLRNGTWVRQDPPISLTEAV